MSNKGFVVVSDSDFRLQEMFLNSISSSTTHLLGTFQHILIFLWHMQWQLCLTMMERQYLLRLQNNFFLLISFIASVMTCSYQLFKLITVLINNCRSSSRWSLPLSTICSSLLSWVDCSTESTLCSSHNPTVTLDLPVGRLMWPE